MLCLGFPKSEKGLAAYVLVSQFTKQLLTKPKTRTGPLPKMVECILLRSKRCVFESQRPGTFDPERFCKHTLLQSCLRNDPFQDDFFSHWVLMNDFGFLTSSNGRRGIIMTATFTNHFPVFFHSITLLMAVLFSESHSFAIFQLSLSFVYLGTCRN